MSAAMQSTLHISFDDPRRPADPPGAPLGGAAVRRLDRAAHAPHLLHRRVPQAARAQLGDRLRAVDPRAWPRASPATRCPTTCSPATACGSSRAWSRASRSSAAGSSGSCSAASSPARRSSAASTRCTSCCCPRPCSPSSRCTWCSSSRTSTRSTRARVARTRTSIGYPILPVYAAKAGGFFFIVFGVVMLMGAFFTINPIWAYGPYDPSPVSAGTQPDWYIGLRATARCA